MAQELGHRGADVSRTRAKERAGRGRDLTRGDPEPGLSPRLQGPGGQESDWRLRVATLNLLEDALEARRGEEAQACARARTDAALRESEMRLKIALDVAGMGTFVWHVCEDRCDADEQMLVLCGLSAAERGDFEAAFAELMHPEDRSRYLEARARALLPDGPGELRADLRVIRPDRTLRWLAISGRVYCSSGTRRAERMVAVVADITARKEIEQALRETLSEAERARRVAESATRAKDQFIALLSHELRTPLTPILMGIATLARRTDLPDAVREALAMIRRNVELESHLVDDLLDVTRIERGKLELNRVPMQLHEVIQAAIEISRPDIDSRHQCLTVRLGAGEQRLLGDRQRLQQAVWNLLKNASKFTPNGGEIRVTTCSAAGSAVLEIADTGIGIDPAAIHGIFDPFQQANHSITRTFGGLGLGLAIAKASICGHGGTIEARSEGPGRGSTFIVHLPLDAP